MAVHQPTGGEFDPLLGVIQTQTEIAKLGLDLGGVMSLVAVRAQALTGAIGAVVELAEGEDLVYRATSGVANAHLGLRLKRRCSLSGLCIDLGVALRCEDSEIDDRVDRDACRRIGLRSMIVVPLYHHDQVVGVLKVLAARPAAFDDNDQQVLTLMSELIAAAMFHAAQYETSELFHRATHDPLTGLPNRALFFERLRHCLAQAQRESRPFAVLNLDMDRLKPINDRFGHRAGDAALRELGARLRLASRAFDTVARLGGDEFAVLLCPIENREGALLHVQRVRDAIAEPFVFEQTPVRLDASIGLAMYPEDGTQIDALMELADQAMYASKRQKKQRHVQE